MATRVSAVDTTAPPMRAMPRPWKMGSATMTAPPMTTAAAVRMIGRARISPDAITASRTPATTTYGFVVDGNVTIAATGALNRFK